MKVFNIIKDSFQEYEGEQSLVVFTQGCNLNCERCHNRPEMYKYLFGEACSVIKEHLTPMHTAVVFLGGEPTIYAWDLYRCCVEVKKMHKKIKLFTNGQSPEVIRKLLEAKLLNSISIDFKCLRDFKEVLGVNKLDYVERTIESINFARYYKVDIELRTTKWKNVDHLNEVIMFVNKIFPGIRHIIQDDILKDEV